MRFGKLILAFPVLIFFINSINAQTTSRQYDSLWKKVEELVGKKGLPQSALAEVKKIYTLAKKEKQEVQVIKALIFQLNLEETTSQDTPQKTIQALEKEITIANEPSRSILNSILAEKYLSYFQRNRWKLYNRTATVNFNKSDIATWDVADFNNKIGQLYLTSIQQEKLLQQTKLAAYDPLIIKGNMRHLRPTLYDLLAHRALNYFRNDERDVTKPAYAFEIKEEAYFAPAAEFIRLKIDTKDTTSLHYKALLVYQRLLSFHLNDSKPDALIDADLARIEFANQYALLENKDSLYLKSLQQITEKYAFLPAATQAWYLMAQWHANKAAQYDPLKDTTFRYEYVAAKNICEAVVKQKDSSEGKINCFNLLNNIYTRELTLTTEKVNIPLQPFRTLVSYRNLSQLYCRIIPLTEDLKTQLKNRNDDQYWKKLTELKFIRNWKQPLPITNDFQKHSVEIKIDPLPIGSYLLLTGNKEDFSFGDNPMAVQYFYVSNISYINRGKEYFVLNRETGNPLNQASVQVWWNKYDYSKREPQYVKGERYITDNNGFFKLSNKKELENNGLRLEIVYNQDKLFMDDNQYYTYYSPNEPAVYKDSIVYEKSNSQVFFFTDRSIYRPGQLVYFKGIAITKDFNSKKSKVYRDYKTTVILYNANYEKVDSLQLTTNEFGSYSGKFQLPENLLNGQFTIKDDKLEGGQSFSVEEYKRPKFYVEYAPIKGTYKVNDSINITGFAKAYAGNNIDGAQIKYRVVRVARFIYPWLYWKWGYPRSTSLEITNGITNTDANGNFTIHFKAIPDLSVSKQFDPIFDYKVIADVTDINGETRTGETIVPVSYKALLMSISTSFGETIPIDSLKNITITTTNLNGEFEPASVKLTIYPLQSPERLIHNRYWNQPDQFVMSEEEYIKNFPHDEYANETDYQSWNKGNKLFEKIDSTKPGKAFSLDATKFKEGWYQAEAITTDKYGQEVKNIIYFQLYNESSTSLPSNLYAWNIQQKDAIEPGEKSTITIGSSAADLFVIQHLDKKLETSKDSLNTAKEKYRYFTLNKEKKSFDFTATENDRGGFGVNYLFIKDNRLYSISNQINVPWTNKELTISYETYRDKTLPGSEEKWKLKISGYKKEKVVSEMLASMYDASLDQFKLHKWGIPGIWQNYYSTINWEGRNCFSDIQSQEKSYENNNWQSIDKRYDDFNFPDNYYSLSRQRFAAGNVAAMTIGRVDKETAYNQSKKSSENDAARETVADSVADITLEEVENKSTDNTGIQMRKNFNETAFFLPDLKTDSAGNIEFSFSIPEALTRWKFQALSHTKELAFGYSSKDIVTQKDLMVQPNAPRFLREGDRIKLSAKVVNITDKEITGMVQLQLLNATTMQPVDALFHNSNGSQHFTAASGQSTTAEFSIEIPYQYKDALVYRFIAKAGDISDGEEASLPVLSNSMLVTETMPLPVRGNTTKNFRFEKLLQSGSSKTLQHQSLTVEFTSNPTWYAVQALPFLMDYPYECAEQTFNRFYANALASSIANVSPRIKAVFEKWKTTDTAALLSNLQKNQELKSVLLAETPWVLEAKTETQQKKNIALLFDMIRMQKELSSSLEKLLQLQSSNGGFVWFKGGPDDRYITQYIIAGIGHLKKLNAIPSFANEKIRTILKTSIPYLDKRVKEDYDQLIKSKANTNNNQLGYIQVQYLYMRSFFPEYAMPGSSMNAISYYRKQSQQFWLQQNKYMQGMIALSLNRTGDKQTAATILKSLREKAIINEEMGMYWKENQSGYYWHQAPVETQSLLIEAFSEISKEANTVDNLKTWLLKQKQTQNWRTTKATAEACYALLLQGSDWLTATPSVEIKLGDKKLISDENVSTEAGTGYFKERLEGDLVNASMGNISVKVSSPNTSNALPTWGAVYWQYFEKLDKITASSTPLKLDKKLFVEKNSDRGPVLQPVNEGDVIKVGDKIKVRIELRVDRDMEYVHMKDMRAACLEPVNVLSGYKWQGGLGYYETTKDASTNFFFNWLPKGTYVFEYPLFVTAAGNFSNGVSSIQCMYAPEFSSHSEGVRINVTNAN